MPLWDIYVLKLHKIFILGVTHPRCVPVVVKFGVE